MKPYLLISHQEQYQKMKRSGRMISSGDTAASGQDAWCHSMAKFELVDYLSQFSREDRTLILDGEQMPVCPGDIPASLLYTTDEERDALARELQDELNKVR